LDLYLRIHPDATLTTIGRTESTTDAPLSFDREALEEHLRAMDSELFQEFPNAGAWLLLPHRKQDDEYSSQVFNTLLRAGLRRRRSPEEVLRANIFSQAASPYFDTAEQYDALIAA